MNMFERNKHNDKDWRHVKRVWVVSDQPIGKFIRVHL